MVWEHGGKPIHDTVFKQAAVLMEGILRLHPFTDGNKRTALLSTARFLYAHDKVLVIPTTNAVDTPRILANIAESETEDNEMLLNAIAEALEVWTSSTLVEGLYQVPLLAPYAASPSDVRTVSRVLKERARPPLDPHLSGVVHDAHKPMK